MQRTLADSATIVGAAAQGCIHHAGNGIARRTMAGALPEGDDAGLVQRARAGDVEAFAALAAEHLDRLGRFCRRLMGDSSGGEDLAQETLLRAQQSIARLGEPYRFGPWLFGIAANLAKKAWRTEARRPLSLESLASAFPNVPWDESHTCVPSPEQASEEAEETRILAEAIASLPGLLRNVVVLHYLNGLDYAEVAAALAVPVSTVKGRLFTSRARLRRELAANGVRGGAGQTDATPEGGPPNSPDASGTLDQHRKKEIPTMPATASTTNARRPEEGRSIRVEVHVDGLVDEALRFITMPWPRSQPLAALENLGSARNRFVPIDVLEQMVLDGVNKQREIAEFMAWVFEPQQFDVR